MQVKFWRSCLLMYSIRKLTIEIFFFFGEPGAVQQLQQLQQWSSASTLPRLSLYAPEILKSQPTTEVCCSVLQCVAVCCSVLQCVAVGCSKVNPRRTIPDPVSVLFSRVQVAPMCITNDIHIYYSYLYTWFTLNMWAPYILQLHFQLSTLNFQNKQWYSYILLICILAHHCLTAPLFTPASGMSVVWVYVRARVRVHVHVRVCVHVHVCMRVYISFWILLHPLWCTW